MHGVGENSTKQAALGEGTTAAGGLTEDEAFILRRVRARDGGAGCAVTMRELGEGTFQKLSDRQTRRVVSILKAKQLLRDGGRGPNKTVILHAAPRQGGAA